MGKFIDLTGEKFFRLTVIERVDNNKHNQVTWKCLCDCGKIHYATTANLRNGSIKSCGCYNKEKCKGKIAPNRKYYPNAVINGFTIIERISIDKLLVKCNKCGIKSIKHTSNLKREGCKYCSGQATYYGFNDINTTAHWLCEYIDDVDITNHHTIHSSKMVYPTCPICGLKSNKQFSISYLYQNMGFKCQKCRNIIKESLPERVFEEILKSLGIKYEKQKMIKTPNRQYIDFFIKKYNLAVEIDGELGHGKRSSFYRTEQSIMLSKKRDEKKDTYLKVHNIDIVRIECHKGFNNIYDSIINSSLKTIFNFSILNKCEIYNSCATNIQSEVIKKFMQGASRKDLSIEYRLSYNTICEYIRTYKNAMNISLRKRDSPRRKIKCITTNEIFQDAYDAAKFCGLKSEDRIRDVCRGKSKTAGKHPKTGEPLRWEYV